MLLQACDQQIRFPRPALVMGVVNVTPDSFSDGGRFFEPSSAIEHALKLVEQGADIIDIGGESTRPNATPVSEEEELRRVLPVIDRLKGRAKVLISIDTMKPGVARAALAAGAVIVNDVGANQFCAEMAAVVAQTGAAYVLMHMQGTPQTMQKDPSYENVVAEVDEFFAAGVEKLRAFGVAREQVILDVGIGFGKTPEHNLRLLGALGDFARWDRPLMLGASRKSFIGKLTGQGEAASRLAGSLACTCWGRAAGAHIFRVHDVAETRQALRTVEAIMDGKTG
jgi:dihydropteroate synthase